MDTSELEAAYRAVLDLAAHAADSPAAAAPARPAPPAGEAEEAWAPGDVLAHLIANDRLLSRAVRSVLEGTPEPYDNADAIALSELRAIGDRLGGTAGLAAGLEASSRELLALAARLDEAQAATPLSARIVDGGVTRVDRPLPVASLLSIQARTHLPMHGRQLAKLLEPA